MASLPQQTGQAREVFAIVGQPVDELERGLGAPTCKLDMVGDPIEIAKGASQVDETRHLRRHICLVSLLDLLPHVASDIPGRMAAAFGNRSIKPVAQGIQAQLADRMANCVFRRRKRTGSDFGFDPLSRIGR